jgi:hypothetical protein
VRGEVQDEGSVKQDEGSVKLTAGTKDGHLGASASASARIKRGECGKRERKKERKKARKKARTKESKKEGKKERLEEEKLRKFNINLYAKTCILSFHVVILSSRVEKYTQLPLRTDLKPA